MKIPLQCAVSLGFVLCATACSSSQEDVSAPATTTSTTTTVAESSTADDTTATDELPSTGFVMVGDIQYDFSFECYADDSGDVLALGVGQEPDSGDPTQAVVQVFSEQPYVGVLVDDNRLLELAIDAPAELFVRSGVISGSALRFVDGDESPGLGESVGLGAVTVECSSFAPGLPEGFDIS